MFHLRASRATPMYGDVIPFRPVPIRQRNPDLSRQSNIKDTLALVAIKMTMLAHVRAETCGAPLQRHLPGQPAFDQRIQTIIDRGQGYVRHLALGADEHFLRRRMIAFPQQHSIDVLALGRKTKTARRQSFDQLVIKVARHRSAHGIANVAPVRTLSIFGIILNSRNRPCLGFPAGLAVPSHSRRPANAVIRDGRAGIALHSAVRP